MFSPLLLDKFKGSTWNKLTHTRELELFCEYNEVMKIGLNFSYEFNMLVRVRMFFFAFFISKDSANEAKDTIL